MMEWRVVDETAPTAVRDVAEAWHPRAGQSRFFTFYGHGTIYCLLAHATKRSVPKMWIELPFTEGPG